MEDEKIIELFEKRDERAVSETKTKYFHYLTKISMNVLGDAGDAEECVNDTYLKAWQNIPPDRPRSLSAYLAVIVRRISLDRIKKEPQAKGAARNTTFLSTNSRSASLRAAQALRTRSSAPSSAGVSAGIFYRCRKRSGRSSRADISISTPSERSPRTRT